MDIQELVKQTVENLRTMADTETVVGKPIQSFDGTVILPVSKLSFGFVAGGGEYGEGKDKKDARDEKNTAKASGAGITVTPVGFLVCGKDKRFISVDKTTDNKWIELARTAFETLKGNEND